MRPVGNYDLPEWLRVTVGLPEENAALLAALPAALAGRPRLPGCGARRGLMGQGGLGRVALLGTGLIGGSLAAALKRHRLASRIVGFSAGR